MLRDLVQVSQQAHNRTKNSPFPDWQSIIQGPAPTLSTAKSSAHLEDSLLQVSQVRSHRFFSFTEAEKELQHLSHLSPMSKH